MSITYTCDMCGKTLIPGKHIRYEVKIEIKAAYDPLDITKEHLEKDIAADIKRLLEKMKNMDPAELHDGVYKVLRYDLCRSCQKHFLKHPVPASSLGQRHIHSLKVSRN